MAALPMPLDRGIVQANHEKRAMFVEKLQKQRKNEGPFQKGTAEE
jgi:hypothetical protein